MASVAAPLARRRPPVDRRGSDSCEIIQLPDVILRQKALLCVVGIRDAWTVGTPGEAQAHEGYEISERQRPDWIVGAKRHGLIKALAARRRKALSNVADNVEQLQKWHQNLAARYRDSAEAMRNWQRTSAEALGTRSYREILSGLLPAGITIVSTLSTLAEAGIRGA